jgi:hypothetical protein
MQRRGQAIPAELAHLAQQGAARQEAASLVAASLVAQRTVS